MKGLHFFAFNKVKGLPQDRFLTFERSVYHLFRSIHLIIISCMSRYHVIQLRLPTRQSFTFLCVNAVICNAFWRANEPSTESAMAYMLGYLSMSCILGYLCARAFLRSCGYMGTCLLTSKSISTPIYKYTPISFNVSLCICVSTYPLFPCVWAFLFWTYKVVNLIIEVWS